MTEEIRNILIEKMLDRPGELTDADISAIRSDEELRDIYNVSVELKGALSPAQEISAADEWQRFLPRIAVRRRRKPLLRRVALVAAAIAGLMLISGIVVKMLDVTPSATDTPLIAGSSGEAVMPADTISVSNSTAPVLLAGDAHASGQLADASVSVRNSTHTASRREAQASQTAPVDVDELMRIEQARIDNEIAMALAEVYEAEYYARLDMAVDLVDCEEIGTEILTSSFLSDDELDKVTML